MFKPPDGMLVALFKLLLHVCVSSHSCSCLCQSGRYCGMLRVK